MEAPLFFRLAELTAPLFLPDERRLADAGELDDLRVGMVLEQRHRMVKLLGIEFGRAAFTEIRVGGARDRLALLRALHDHVALELLSPQEHELVPPGLKTYIQNLRCQNRENGGIYMIFGYARVSTKTQTRDGNSLDAQQAALTAAGAEKIYTDTFTGTKIERPEFDRRECPNERYSDKIEL